MPTDDQRREKEGKKLRKTTDIDRPKKGVNVRIKTNQEK